MSFISFLFNDQHLNKFESYFAEYKAVHTSAARNFKGQYRLQNKLEGC